MASKTLPFLCLIVIMIHTDGSMILTESSTNGKLRSILLASFLNNEINPTQSIQSNNCFMIIFLENFPSSCAIPSPNGGKITTCYELHQTLLTDNVDERAIRVICNSPWNLSTRKICSSFTPGFIRDTCLEICGKFSGKRNLCE